MSKGATTPAVCPVCQNAHWQRDPHIFSNKVADVELQSPRPMSQHERQMVDITPVRKVPAPRIEVAKAALVEAEKPKVKRGRPATGFDKKAYDKQKAKERRDAKKAAERLAAEKDKGK